MKIQIATITLGILMLASCLAMYAGESYSFKTNYTNPVYTVTGNNSNLDGLNVTFENNNITISTVQNYKPDNFTIIFFDNITNEVIKTIHTSGGHSTKIEYVDKNVTKFIPQYINNTKEVEVEKIIDNTTVIETGFEYWHIILGVIVGVLFGWYMVKDIKKDKMENKK